MDVVQNQKARETKKKVLGKRLVEERCSVIDLILDGEHDMIFDCKRLQENVNYFWQYVNSMRPKCTGFIPNELGRNQDISLVLPIQEGKRRHYWFWSTKPDRGKTTFLRQIKAQFKANYYNKQENFQTFESDIQFLLFDEFTIPFLRVQCLNEMCDGTYQYPQKGGKAMTLNNPIVLVCGNKHPFEMYTDPFNHDLIKARFYIIDLK